MNCKFCNAVLEEDVTVCPECGKDLMEATEKVSCEEVLPEEMQETVPEETVEEVPADEEPVEKTAPLQKKNIGKVVAAVVCCAVLALILVGAVLYGLGIDLMPRPNDVMCKDSFTVSDKVGERKADNVVAKVGDMELTNAELQIYYLSTVNNYLAYYGTNVLDSSMALEDQIQDEVTGKTWQQFFLENALNTWHSYAALNQRAEEEKYQLSETISNSLATLPEQMEETAKSYAFENAEQMIKADWTDVCNLDAYTNYLNTYLTSMDYYDAQYNQFEPTMEEMETFFSEHEAEYAGIGVTKDSGKYVDVRHILIVPEGGTEDENGVVTYSDAEWDTCRDSAQALLDQWKEGEATEESFGQLASEKTQDPGSASTGGLYTDVVKGQMVEPFENWCFDESRQTGDTGLVQTNYGYHIMYYVGGEEIWVVSTRMDLVSKDMDELMTQCIDKWPMEVNYKKIILGEIFANEA